jgi:hypothetical protein
VLADIAVDELQELEFFRFILPAHKQYPHGFSSVVMAL